ncbi:hypothetical protein GCM10009569_12060 [Arthrobacter russicus]|jgi:hypothetical protein
MNQFSAAAISWASAGGAAGPAQRVARQLSSDSGVRSVVLVEGASDQAAVEALALRHGRDFETERIAVIPMGGVTNIAKFSALLGPEGLGLTLAGLCDLGEARYFRRALARAYPAAAERGPDWMQRLGFFICDTDLEVELIRALGVDRVQQVIAEQGDLRPWQTLQQQPAQQGRSIEQQLHRFMGTTSGRKIHYGAVLVEALDPAQVPAPLAGLLDFLGVADRPAGPVG